MTERSDVLLSSSRALFAAAAPMLRNFCAIYHMDFSTSETPCMNECVQWTFFCGLHNVVLSLNHSHVGSYFSVRTLVRKYGTTPGEFTAVVLRERRFDMLHRSDGSATWVSRDVPGEKRDTKEMAELCLHDLIDATSPR